jgi:hypothetical protein
MDGNDGLSVEVDDSPLDTVTIKLWRDGGYNGQPCPPEAPWMAVIGPDIMKGVAGSGASQGDAILDLCTRIMLRQGPVVSDDGALLLSADDITEEGGGPVRLTEGSDGPDGPEKA